MWERSLPLLLGVLLIGSACSKSANEAHYAEVEKHRQEQAAQPAAATAATPTAATGFQSSPGFRITTLPKDAES